MITTQTPDLELFAAHLEADQANRDFMSEWINGTDSLYSENVQALRHYRDAAERAVDDMINQQIAEISPEPEPEDEDHIDYPHWPGTLYGCTPCEREMQAQAEQEYDEQEWRS